MPKFILRISTTINAFARFPYLFLFSLSASASIYPTPFLPPVVFLAPSIFATKVVIADFNGDGLNDVIMTGDGPLGASGTLYIYLQDKNGNLSQPITQQLPYSPIWLAAGDLNGDGRLDIAIGSFQNRIDVLYQDPQGNLSTPTTLSTAASGAIAIADMNGDGRLDLLGFGVNTTSGTTIDTYYQNSDGTLSAPAQYQTPFISWAPSIGDVTGDGLPDILLSSGSTAWSDDFVTLPQNPDHSFGPAIYSGGSGLGGGALAIGDTNGDGRNDVVSSVFLKNSGSNNIDVFTQDASRLLHAAATYSVVQGPSSFHLADFDGDGRMDIAMASDGYAQVGVYMQGIDGKFTNQQLYNMPLNNGWPAIAYGPQAIAVGDINSDGKPDIVVANADVGLAVLYNSLGTYPTNDLSVSLTSSPNPAVVDSPVTLAFLVSNAGPSTATGVVLTNALPPSFTYQSSDSGCSSSSGVISCAIGKIPAGSSTTVNIFARPNTSVAIFSYGQYPFTNEVVVAGNEIDYAQDNNILTTMLNATNPSPGTVQFSASSYSVSAGSGTTMTQIDVTRSNGHGIQQVWWATGGLTADPGVDYQQSSGVLTWGDGDNSTKSFSVEILQNNAVSVAQKTVQLSLEQPLVGAIGLKSTAILTINVGSTSNSAGGQTGGGTSPSSGAGGGGGAIDDLTMFLLIFAALCQQSRWLGLVR